MFMAIPAHGRADGPLDKLKLGLATTHGTCAFRHPRNRRGRLRRDKRLRRPPAPARLITASGAVRGPQKIDARSRRRAQSTRAATAGKLNACYNADYAPPA